MANQAKTKKSETENVETVKTVEKEIDVVIPAYNAGYTIDKTLMSIAVQNIVDKVCVIIVDDVSSAEHTKLYRKYMNQFNNYFRIEYIKLKENSGPGIARREGLSFGSSKFVTFIDADDVFATSTALFTLYKELNTNEKLNYCNSIFQEEVRDQNNNFYDYNDHTNDMTWMFGKMYRRSFLEHLSINFNCSRSNEDCGFNTVCMLMSTTENVKYIPRLTYCWNYNELSITKNNDYSFWGLKGYIYNNIWSIHEAFRRLDEVNKDENAFGISINKDVVSANLVHHVVNTMTICYLYYECLYKDNRPKNQVDIYLGWALDFYRDIYIQYRKFISNEIFIASYKRVRTNHANMFDNYVERTSFIEFLEFLDKYFRETEQVERVTNNKNDIIGYIKNSDIERDENGNITMSEESAKEKLLEVSYFNKYLKQDERYKFLFEHNKTDSNIIKEEEYN